MGTACDLAAHYTQATQKQIGKQIVDGKYPEPISHVELTAEDVKDIRKRPNVLVTEQDANGNFIRQQNLFNNSFGTGKDQNPVEKGRYRLIWAKGCNWSNRVSIARELLGLEDIISVNVVGRDDYDGEDYGWEFVFDEGHIDPVLGVRFLNQIYEKSYPGFPGRATVPSLVDVTTGTVANNDYHHLTNYLEVDFKEFHKPGAPELYPEELRDEIDKLNEWLFDNINNGVYKIQFATGYAAFRNAYDNFYAAMDILEDRLADRRFLFGDYVTDSDIRLYVTLARLDTAYSQNFGPTKHRLVDYPNLWGYARDLWQIPAFQNNTYFRDFSRSFRNDGGKSGAFKSFQERFLDEINFDELWGSSHGRQELSHDPANKFRTA